MRVIISRQLDYFIATAILGNGECISAESKTARHARRIIRSYVRNNRLNN